MNSSAVTTCVAGIACILVVLTPALLPTAVHAQTLTIPTGWIATAEPRGPFEEHSKLFEANHSGHEWRVSVPTGQLQIRDDGSCPHKEAGLVLRPHFHRTKDMIGRAMTARAVTTGLLGLMLASLVVDFGGPVLTASARNY